MSDQQLLDVLGPQLADLTSRGLYKKERQIQGPQGSAIRVAGREVINFCANNYLGLANHPAVVDAAHEGLRRYGYGLSSVRRRPAVQSTAIPLPTLRHGRAGKRAQGIGQLPTPGDRH
jgi:7-keto-8-aminopelargonate synthetase-like enzyme